MTSNWNNGGRPPGRPLNGGPAPYVPPSAPGHHWAAGAQRNDGLAIAALVCGIASLPFLFLFGAGSVLAILGLVFGLVSIRRINGSGGVLLGKGMAQAGAICGAVTLGLVAIYIIAFIVLGLGLAASSF
jgi:hypothetical protein